MLLHVLSLINYYFSKDSCSHICDNDLVVAMNREVQETYPNQKLFLECYFASLGRSGDCKSHVSWSTADASRIKAFHRRALPKKKTIRNISCFVHPSIFFLSPNRPLLFGHSNPRIMSHWLLSPENNTKSGINDAILGFLHTFMWPFDLSDLCSKS